MNMKKILTALLSGVVIVGTMTVSAMAANTLPEAVDGTIKLTEDVVLEETYAIVEDVEIDLNGYKITSADITGEQNDFSPLIKITDADVIIVDSSDENDGVIVPGVKNDIKSYNNTVRTIELRNGSLIVDGAVIKGQHGVNTKWSGVAIEAYETTVTIEDSEIYGGDSEKKDIGDNTSTYYTNQGTAGKAIVSYGSDIVIIDSKIYGGSGTATGDTKTTGYISGGANQADGVTAIELRGATVSKVPSTLSATGSEFYGGNSALRNPAEALNIQGNTEAVLDDCVVVGGSVKPGMGNYGVGGNGLYLSGTPTVTVKNSSITAGVGLSSTKNGALEISSSSANPTVVVENSTLDGGKYYAIGGSGKQGSFTLIDTTIKADEALVEAGTVSQIFAEGEITVDENSASKTIDVEIISMTGATIIGSEDENIVVAPSVATVNGEYYSSLDDALVAADEIDSAVVTILPGTYELGKVEFPRSLSGVTIRGNDTVLVNSAFVSFGGDSVNYQDITIENIEFDNSYILFTGHRVGADGVTYKNWTIKDCEFYDLETEAAVFFNLAPESEHMENFTFTNNVIKNVTGEYKSGMGLNSSMGTINISGNEISNVAWNAIQLIDVEDGSVVTISGNELSSGADEGVVNLYNVNVGVTLADNEIKTLEGQPAYAYFTAVKAGEKFYASIDAAIAGATAGDTITIPAGTYAPFTIPTDKNNLTVVGETDANGNNLVTIKTLESDVTTHNGGIFVQAETFTLKNVNVTAGTVGGASSTWMSSSIGNTNGDTGMRSNLKNLTIEGCSFTGSGAYQAVWTNQGNITVKNTTITNYTNGIDNYGIGANQEVVIENSEITDVTNAFHTGEAEDGAKIKVTGTTIESDKIDVGGAVAVTITESEITGAKATAYAASSITVTESALYGTSFATDGSDSAVALSAVYADNIDDIVAGVKDNENITFTTYYPSEDDLGNTDKLVDVPMLADYIKVVFDPANDAEGEKVYNINLVAIDNQTINRLNSVDLTFKLANTTGKTEFEIIASNSEVAINPVNNSTVRYEFHYEGKDGVKTDTANVITIGQVKFTGYGAFTFAVDTDANATNAAHATKVADSIVDTFLPNGEEGVQNGELVLDNAVIDGEILVPTRDLTINVAFPNSVENNAFAYQQMKVTVSGGDLAKAIVVELGNGFELPEIDTDVKPEAAVTAEFVNGAYVVTLTDALTYNTSYNVEVSGAGYRTARYTVTMQGEDTDGKVLNFWNNVKDNDTEVETGKSTSAKKVTYLAGDIVKDSLINIYDLSAVVSYFGETELVGNNNTYAKYDLNRDGKIDSKDVAYVLVSWGK